ncbi:hypothetical protein VB775_23650 [Pseudanabaena sp. CCNP1317]|nr:hypothetical protein [Pseudanabaena sp. CCNP1317]
MVNFGSEFKGNQESIYTYDIMMAIAIVLRRNTALGRDRNTSLKTNPKIIKAGVARLNNF